MRKYNMKSWLALSLFTFISCPALSESNYPPVDVLLQSPTTVIGQKIVYPEGAAQITALIVTMESGQTTGWHKHEAPLTAHILQGELTVDYGAAGTRIYTKGDTFVEALGSEHNGQNTGKGLARIFVVFSGAIGTHNTVAN